MNDASHESVAPKLRRQFTASEKLRLVKAADVALASGERGALEALLRKETIYSSQLAAWRQQLGARRSRSLRVAVPWTRKAPGLLRLAQRPPSPLGPRPFTPADVFYGRVAEVAAVRQAALDAGYRAHPERFPNGAPGVPLPPAAVHINPIVTEAVPVTDPLSAETSLPTHTAN